MNRETYAARKAANLCAKTVKCMKPAWAGVFCAHHRRKERHVAKVAAKVHYNNQRNAGICCVGGCDQPAPRAARCKRHLEERRAWVMLKRAAGACEASIGCADAVTRGRVCERHRRIARASHRANYHDRVAAGICPRCKVGPLATGSCCRQCYLDRFGKEPWAADNLDILEYATANRGE